jgi:hypothetical protein
LGAIAASSAVAATPATLNILEVRSLAARANPDDHARLRDHFAALAETYHRDAARDKARATSLIGNPNRQSHGAPAAHFERLAEQSRRIALALTELASHHGRLAAGYASTQPADAAKFLGGFGARVPTAAEVREHASRGRAAHLELEEYFSEVAAGHHAIVERHRAMARAYRVTANRRTPAWDPATQCDRFVHEARKAEQDAMSRARMHRQLATIG